MIMRFPSLGQIQKQTLTVIRRFPLELFVAITGSVTATMLSYHHSDRGESQLIRVLLLCLLSLPSFIAVTLRGRFRQFSTARRIGEYVFVALLLAIFYLSEHDPLLTKDVMRFILLNIAAHLLVSGAGFIRRGSTLAFWQFNRHLFLRIITSGIFSAALFAGLAGALAAVDVLFQVKVESEWYLRLFIWIAGVFNTVFFLAGVPDNQEELEGQLDYPKVLKVFTQFVLVPLVLIYLAILLAYETRIIIQWKLPNGWVSNLIIAYGIAGILSILLVYPIRSMEGNHWIKLFARWFYLLLIPLIVLMFVAIGIRVSAYGFTEERVFVLALAFWLAGISVYFLLRPNGDIRVIPVSLALLVLILSVGPMSAFEIGKRSQRGRLVHLLEKNGMLKGRKAVRLAPGHRMSFADRKGLSSTVQYLLQYHGNESVAPYFSTDSLEANSFSAWSNAQHIMRSIGVEYTGIGEREDVDQQNGWYNFNAAETALSVKGFDEFLLFNSTGYSDQPTAVHIRETATGVYAVFRGDERISPFIDPAAMLAGLIGRNGRVQDKLKPGEMAALMQGKGCSLMIAYQEISGQKGKGKDVSFRAAVFIRWE